MSIDASEKSDRGRRQRGQKVYVSVAQEIVRHISDLPRGTVLPAETQMLEQYGVGRASLREALRILESHGLIWIKPGPGGGPVVEGVHAEDFGRMATLFFQMGNMTFGELMEARIAIEPMMARLQASAQDPEVLEWLEHHSHVGRRDALLEDERSYRDAGREFHLTLAGHSQNRILSLFAHAILGIFYDRVRGELSPTSRRGEIADSHVEIAKAIASGDGARAEQVMREHLQQLAEAFARRYPEMMGETIDWG